MADLVRSVALDYSKLKSDHPDYSGKQPAEIRRAIKKILDLCSFSIATEEVSQAIVDNTGAVTPESMSVRGVISGVTWVNGNADGTDNTGKIEYGKPVVFDVTTGKTVTGINAKWAEDEYKVLGIALDEVASGQKLIPVAVGQTPQSETSTTVLAKARVKTGTYPTLQSWSEAASATEQRVIWEFELPKTSAFIEANVNSWFNDVSSEAATRWQGSGEFVKAFNLDRTYVYKDMPVLLHKANKGAAKQFYFNFQMASSIVGTLDGDLSYNGNALITIDTAFNGGIQGSKCKIYDNRLLPAGKKLLSGTKVWATLEREAAVGNENTPGAFQWKFYVTQADACPVSI